MPNFSTYFQQYRQLVRSRVHTIYALAFKGVSMTELVRLFFCQHSGVPLPATPNSSRQCQRIFQPGVRITYLLSAAKHTQIHIYVGNGKLSYTVRPQ